MQVQLRLTLIGYEGAVYTGASKYRQKGIGVEYNSRSLTRSVGVSGTVEVNGRIFEVEVEGQSAQLTSYRLERRPYVN